MKTHTYTTRLIWTGNRGSGTFDYRAYSRNFDLVAEGKQVTIPGSSDPAFRGEPGRYNPEELFLSSISSCHMLWYLHLCASSGIVVMNYTDEAKGVMAEDVKGGGRFTEVTLYPVVTLADATRTEEALSLHEKANALCFIANSCNFPIKHKAEIEG